MLQIEEFLFKYQNIIQALVAIGTVGSVIVSLLLVNPKPKLKGIISLMYSTKCGYIPVERSKDIKNLKIEKETEYLIAQVNNIGIVPATISLPYFYIKIPFSDYHIIELPYETTYLKSHILPCIIGQGECKYFIDSYFEIPNMYIKNCFYRFILYTFSTKLLQWTKLCQIQISIYTNNQKVLKLQISQYLNDRLINLAIKK